MKLMKIRLLHTMQAMALLGLLAVVGCQSLGLPSAETFNQKLAVAYTSVTSIRQTALVLLQADKITAADAQQVQAQADNARAGLDIARQIHATQPDAGASKLASVLTALTALQTYLDSRNKP